MSKLDVIASNDLCALCLRGFYAHSSERHSWADCVSLKWFDKAYQTSNSKPVVWQWERLADSIFIYPNFIPFDELGMCL